MLNVAVRKKLLLANPCSGVEFPMAVKGLFRPHYVTWSEQQQIESHASECLRNAVRIITETGLRVYKELTPMRKDQVDIQNAVVWIPDSKTPNGVAEVPLTPLAIQAFSSQTIVFVAGLAWIVTLGTQSLAEGLGIWKYFPVGSPAQVSPSAKVGFWMDLFQGGDEGSFDANTANVDVFQVGANEDEKQTV